MGIPPRRWIAASAAAAVFAVAFPALGGVVLRNEFGTQIHWNLDLDQQNVIDGAITLFIVPAGSSQPTPGEPSEYETIAAAAEAWNAPTGGRIRFLPDPSRPAIEKKATDRVNYVAFRKFVLSPYTLAATFTSASAAVVTDADIIFNDDERYVVWSTDTPGHPGYADVGAVAAHELGHVAGLDHSPAAEATMYPVVLVGGISSRTPGPDDAMSARLAYPVTLDPTKGSIFGKVFLGKKSPRKGVAVFALNASDASVAGCTLSEETGTYRLPGLVPGPYFVLAVPLADPEEFHSWWHRAATNILPAFLVDEIPAGSRTPRQVQVRAGFPETGNDIHVQKRTRKRSGEPDDDATAARLLELGGAAVGVFESAQDQDWFRVRADGTNALDLRLRCWGLGSSANPALQIVAGDGVEVLLTVLDKRAPSNPTYYAGPLGYEMDAEVVQWVPPGPGDYFVRVWPQYSTGTGGPGAFYALMARPSDGVPDASRTEITLDPPASRIPDGPAVTLTVVPRGFLGEDLGPGCTVEAWRFDGVEPLTLADAGDGSYWTVLDPPTEPGAMVITVTVTGPRGTIAIHGGALLPVAGTAHANRSTLVASPRRLEADGVSLVTLVLTPRDQAGLLLGPALDADVEFEGAPAGILGPAVDAGDGTYVALLKAPSSPGSAWIGSLVNGFPLGVSRLVGFGYELDLVAADAAAEAGQALGLPGPSTGDTRRFETAEAQLEAVVAALDAEDEAGAVAAAARAAAALWKAGASPRWPEARDAAYEMAESLLRRAHALVDPIVVPAIDPRGQKILLAARAVLSKGDKAMEDGNFLRAAKLCAASIRKALPLLD